MLVWVECAEHFGEEGTGKFAAVSNRLLAPCSIPLILRSSNTDILRSWPMSLLLRAVLYRLTVSDLEVSRVSAIQSETLYSTSDSVVVIAVGLLLNTS